MKSKVCKNLIAIFCLVSLSVYSKNNLEKERDFKMYKAKVYNVVERDVLFKISGNGNQSAIGKSRAVAVLDWTKAPNSYIFDPAQNGEGLYILVKRLRNVSWL